MRFINNRMKIEDFFQLYANTQLTSRSITVNMMETGMMTLAAYYERLTKLEDQIRPLRIEEDELLKLAEKVFKNDKKI